MPWFDDVQSLNDNPGRVGRWARREIARRAGALLKRRGMIPTARPCLSTALLAGLLAVAWAGPIAQAQQTAGAAAKAPAPPAADPAKPADPSKQTPPAPTPEHVAKARRLILATGISRSFQIIVPEFMDQIGNTLTQARPDLVHDMIIVLEELRPEFEKQSDEMIDLSAKIYATLLSEKDLDAILAFYDSEAGRKYVAAQSLYINQLIPGSQAWQQKIAINMMARVRQEMKKKGHDL